MKDKKIIYIFTVFISTLTLLLFSFSLYAQSVQLQIPIGDKKDIPVCSGGLCHGIALYIVEFAKWFVGAISLLAVTAIMFGGIWWLTAAGSSKKVDEAKKIIWDSFVGLILVLGSYLFLSLISPDLIKFKGISLQSIENIGFEMDVTAEMYAVSPPNISGSGASNGKVNLGSAKAGDLVSYTPHQNLSTRATGKLRPQAATALKKAAEICAKKGKKIIVGSDFRDFDGQVQAYKRFLRGGNLACNPGTDPNRVRCPHTSGQAVDLDTGNHCINKKPDPVTARCMKEAGFDCVLMNGGECWHYEYPPLSGACVDPAKYF